MAVSSSDTSRAIASRPDRHDRRHAGCDDRADSRPGTSRRTRRCSHGAGSASSTAISARLAPIGSLPAWRRPRKSWATGERSCAEPARSTSSASRSRASAATSARSVRPGHGAAPWPPRATASGPRSPSGPGSTQRQTVGRAADGGSPGMSSRSRGAPEPWAPTTATCQRHLRPPLAPDLVSPFNRPPRGQLQPFRRFPGRGHPYGPEMGRISFSALHRRPDGRAALAARLVLRRRPGDRPIDHRSDHARRSRRRRPPTPTRASTRSAPSRWPSKTAGGSSSGTRQPLTPPSSPPSPSTSPACSGPTSRR